MALDPAPDFDALDRDALRRSRGEKWTSYPADVLPVWVADTMKESKP